MTQPPEKKDSINNVQQVVACERYLSQGDIFCTRLQAPISDTELKILRTQDGYLGNRVFEDKCRGRFFSFDEVAKMSEENQNVPPPFSDSSQGNKEMVVVWANSLEYFIVASQTCDISGISSSPKPYSVVLPFVATGHMLAKTRFPIQIDKEHQTICAFLEESIEEVSFTDLFESPWKIVSRVRESLSKIKDKKTKANIKSLLNSKVLKDTLYLYYIDSNMELHFPEGHVDFLRPQTIATNELDSIKDTRLCTLHWDYKNEFATKLGNFYSRVAVPQQMKPAKFK